MADVKISELSEKTAWSGNDLLIVEDSDTKKMKVSTLRNLLGQAVNVKDFGAIGDNTADDTVAIQAAIDSASTSEKAVFFPAGDYKITDTLVLGQSAKLVGEGMHKSFLRCAVAVPIIHLAGTTGTPIYYIELSDLALVGSNTATVGIKFDYARECFIKNCFIGYCVKGITMNWSWSNSVIECSIGANTTTNIELGDQSNDTSIADCALNDAGSYGIHITDDSQNVSITSTTIQKCGKEGIKADAGMAISIVGCYLEGNSELQLSTPDIDLNGLVHGISGVSIIGTIIWSKYSSVSIKVENVDALTLVGCVIKLLSGYTTTDAFSFTSYGTDFKTIGCYLAQPNENWFNIYTTQVDGRTYLQHRLSDGTMQNIFSITNTNRVEWEKTLDMNGNLLVGATYLMPSCTTATRPTPTNQQVILDTTIGKPIWWNGTVWKDFAGNTV